MASPTILYLLRHAAIAPLPVAEYDDTVLTNAGAAQIYALSRNWPHPKPDVIYCSPLPRSVETASVCAGVFRAPVRSRMELEEWAATEKEVSEAEYLDLERRCWSDFSFRNEYGESLTQATERIVNALLAIARHHEGKRVLVSGHAILFALFMAHVRGGRATEAYKNTIQLGSYAIVEYDGRFRIVKDFNG